MPTVKLSDTQLILLSSAAKRTDGVVQLTPTLRGRAAQKVVGKLLRLGLVKEFAAGLDIPAWRDDGRDRAIALRITPRGLAAIGIDPAEAASAKATAPPSRERVKRPHEDADSGHHGSGSKKQRVIALLRQPGGTTIAQLASATGWRPHSVRGFLAGTVRRKLGLTLTSGKESGTRVYRVSD